MYKSTSYEIYYRILAKLSEKNEIIEFLPPIYNSIEFTEHSNYGPLYSVSNENKFGVFIVTVDLFPLDEIKSSAYFVVPPNYTKIREPSRKAGAKQAAPEKIFFPAMGLAPAFLGYFAKFKQIRENRDSPPHESRIPSRGCLHPHTRFSQAAG